MMKKLFFLVAMLACTTITFAQFDNIGLLGGSTVTGWTSDTDMMTTDGIIYTLNDVVITVPENDPGVKFRKDDAWDVSWGGSDFPSGVATTANGPNIPAVNGTYNVVFNKLTGAYSFVDTTGLSEVSLVVNAMNIEMFTTDGIVYNANNIMLEDGNVIFSVDETTTWGSIDFPTGTAVENQQIPVLANSYNISFNIDTKAYNFENVTVFSDVNLSFGGTDVPMTTTDGVTYNANNVTLEAGNVTFSVDGATTWGSIDFPTGTAVENQQIPVLANSYNISFNLDTKAYSFDFVIISMIGDGVVDWSTDTEMATTDGVNYTYMLTSAGGEGKFRLNNDWNPGWGSTDFPSGIGSTEGDAPNIPIAAGTYDVSFNRLTGAYNFASTTASIADFSKGNVKVYPNPSNTVWNFDAGSLTIDNVEVIDVTGKVVYASAFAASQVTVNADALAPGIYFTRVYSGASVQTIKVVKK